jgi:hypothetical protein
MLTVFLKEVHNVLFLSHTKVIWAWTTQSWNGKKKKKRFFPRVYHKRTGNPLVWRNYSKLVPLLLLICFPWEWEQLPGRKRSLMELLRPKEDTRAYKAVQWVEWKVLGAFCLFLNSHKLILCQMNS